MPHSISPDPTIIVTENPNRDTWKLLRRFLDPEYTIPFIRAAHNIWDKSHDKNFNKQAIQIAYCIRQAEEYFQAAQQVTLVTRPTLIYYGISSLAQALVLLKGTGEVSIDYLRKQKKERHHGIEITGDFFAKRESTISLVDFLKSIECKPHLDVNTGAFWGTFANFYKSLGHSSYVLTVKEYQPNTSVHQITQNTFVSFGNPELSQLKSHIFNCFELAINLPDLVIPPSLLQLYAFGELVQCNIEAFYTTDQYSLIRSFEANFYISRPDSVALRKWLATVNGIPEDDVSSFLGEIAQQMGRELDQDEIQEARQLFAKDYEIRVESHLPFTTRVKWRKHKAQSKEGYHIFFSKMAPEYSEKVVFSVVENLQGQHFLKLNDTPSFTEPAIFFVLSYCFSMLARYAPDIWVQAVDKNVQIAEFTDSLLYLIGRKFPVLVLDQMTNRKHQMKMVAQGFN